MHHHLARLILCSLLLTAPAARAATVNVSNTSDLHTALNSAAPGDTILLAPGTYTGGLHIDNRSGAPGGPITVAAADPANPPVFAGGSTALQLSDCNYLTLRDLRVTSFTLNGINIDDAGSFDSPAHHVTFENLLIERIGPTGNHDALKLSGLDHFTIRNCTFRGWGGSAIDMVGCHDGTIETSTFEGIPGHEQATGIQIKGGSRAILIRWNFFSGAGQRAINLGGSTGLPYFRPADADAEADAVEVYGNRFAGSQSPVAFVTARGGHVHHNTFYLPEKWALRILQETTDPRFIPCQGGLFEHNLILFDARVQTFVNVGPGTLPETFTFRDNAWFDLAGSRAPSLPSPETGGVYNVNPELRDPGTARMSIGSTDPRLAGKGADAMPPPSAAATRWPGL